MDIPYLSLILVIIIFIIIICEIKNIKTIKKIKHKKIITHTQSHKKMVLCFYFLLCLLYNFPLSYQIYILLRYMCFRHKTARLLWEFCVWVDCVAMSKKFHLLGLAGFQGLIEKRSACMLDNSLKYVLSMKIFRFRFIIHICFIKC